MRLDWLHKYNDYLPLVTFLCVIHSPTRGNESLFKGYLRLKDLCPLMEMANEFDIFTLLMENTEKSSNTNINFSWHFISEVINHHSILKEGNPNECPTGQLLVPLLKHLVLHRQDKARNHLDSKWKGFNWKCRLPLSYRGGSILLPLKF